MPENYPHNEPVPSLGSIETSDKTYSNDVIVSDRYQTFSAELLRLSLLGIAGIGFLVVNILLKDESRELVKYKSFMGFLSASLVFLGLSAASALLHRWLSTDSLAEHLLLIRLEKRKAEGDSERLKKSRKKRKKQFKRSGLTLLLSSLFLWLGAVCLSLSFIFGIFYPR
jgi:hypothetical protein